MLKKIIMGLVVLLVAVGIGTCAMLAKQKIDKNNELRQKESLSREESRVEKEQSPKPSLQEPIRKSEAPVVGEKMISDEEAEQNIQEMEALMSESEAELESFE